MKKKILLFIFTIMLTITGLVNVNAYDKYDGDYTIEYLLRNYNVVTLGTKDRYDYSVMNNGEHEPGSVTNVFDIGGPVLIRGNYTGDSSYDNEFAQKTNGIPSYIKGKMGPNINPGSIESAELSNIYVGSYNALKQEDGTYKLRGSSNEFNYPIIKSDDYLDFDKLYAAIVNEQKNIDRGTELKETEPAYWQLNTATITINQPGNYYIKDIDLIKYIKFENFNPNKLYIITVDNEIVYNLPFIQGFTRNEKIVYCGREGQGNPCTGNVIWNFPNARYIYTNWITYGHIVAPKADIELKESNYPGAIIANSITSEINKHTAIQFYPYNLNEKISTGEVKTTIEETVDLDSDIYTGNYSIDELLKNYSVVTLGQKEYGSITKLSTLSNVKGTANIFHIVGQFLINGDLGVEGLEYPAKANGSSGARIDLKYKDENMNSYLNGILQVDGYQPEQYDDAKKSSSYIRTKNNKLYVSTKNDVTYMMYDSYMLFEDRFMLTGGSTLAPEVKYKMNSYRTNRSVFKRDNYMNFKVLYDSIVEQQKNISEGTLLKVQDDGMIHVPGGGNYTIENISDIEKIMFDDYESHKDELIVITIKDTGNVTLPIVRVETGGQIPFTNDWYGGETNLGGTAIYKYYEMYKGNIVWNIPNASYLTLRPLNPFIGHVIAPNADVETPELHFAGAMIVNSLYSEGYSEAHFYPLNVGSVGTGIELETKTIGEDEPDKITISGTKTWDDNDDQDGVRPKTVTINLLANGEKVDSVEISEDTDWKYEFNVDRVDSKGVKIVYTVTENSIDNYATEIETITENTCSEGCVGTIVGYNITNSYTPKKTSLTVNKVWDDDNNKEGLRPDKVEIQLYADGEKLGEPVELNEENNWTYIFNELDMRSKGKDIKYTVEEITKLDRYKVEVTGTQEEGYTITNTFIEEIKDNPTTLDNISKFTIISIISSVMLVLGIVFYTRIRRREV